MSEKREKQTKSKRRIWRGVTTATASLLTLSMSATLVIDGFRTDIDKFLGTQSTKMVTEDVSAEDYTFQSDYSSTTELLDSIEDLGERMNEEGSVLLKNENAALPLSKEETQKISLLGFSSYYPVQGGDFGSTLSENKGTDADTVDMLEAFESKGFEMNPTLKKMYQGLKEEFKSEAVLPWGVTTYYRATAPATTGVFTSLEPETATLDEAEPNNWAGRITCQGREVFDSPFTNACAHHFQMLTFLLGPTMRTACDIESVQAELYRANPTIENYDIAALRFQTAQGLPLLYYTAHPINSLSRSLHSTLDAKAFLRGSSTGIAGGFLTQQKRPGTCVCRGALF